MKTNGKNTTYIGVDMYIKGEVNIEGPAIIAGQVEGNIRSSDTIHIEVGGQVNGDVICHFIKVCGTLTGKLVCDHLLIVNTGIVEAEVSSHQMEIADGGQFIGVRKIGPDTDTLPKPNPQASLVNTKDATQTQHAMQVSSSDTSVSKASEPSLLATKGQDSQVSTSSKNSSKNGLKSIVPVLLIAGAGVLAWQTGVFSKPSTDVDIEPALFNQVEPELKQQNVAERDAAKLLDDVTQEQFLKDQQETINGAAAADPDMAMEDLHAMEASHALLNEEFVASDSDSEKSLDDDKSQVTKTQPQTQTRSSKTQPDKAVEDKAVEDKVKQLDEAVNAVQNSDK